jgi:hypothetical protein
MVPSLFFNFQERMETGIKIQFKDLAKVYYANHWPSFQILLRSVNEGLDYTV